MAKYYWKGSAAGFPKGTTGASYVAWIAATSIGATANWAYSIGTVGSGVTGATGIPGVADTVFISDRFPTLGSTLSGVTGTGAYTYVLSPCLNSSNAILSASVVTIGPFNNFSTDGLPLETGLFGHARVGGPTLGNSSITETIGYTAANLVGYPLGVSAGSATYIYDTNNGAYDINIVPKGANTPITFTRVAPAGESYFNGPAFSITDRPWKLQTALRIEGGSAKSLLIQSGIVLNELKISPLFTIIEDAGVTASCPVNLLGQIFNTTIPYGSGSGLNFITISPNIRCFDASVASTYTLSSSIRRNGDTNGLSPQNATSYADLTLNSALRAQGISLGTILPYTVILGTNPTEAEPAANTDFKFATLGSGTQTGAPLVKLRGTVTLSDFSLASGRLVVDSTSIFGQQGVICTNGRISSSAGADLGGLVRLSPVNDELVPGAGIGSTYVPSSGYYGIRITEAALVNTTFSSNTTIETNSGSPFPS